MPGRILLPILNVASVLVISGALVHFSGCGGEADFSETTALQTNAGSPRSTVFRYWIADGFVHQAICASPRLPFRHGCQSRSKSMPYQHFHQQFIGQLQARLDMAVNAYQNRLWHLRKTDPRYFGLARTEGFAPVNYDDKFWLDRSWQEVLWLQRSLREALEISNLLHDQSRTFAFDRMQADSSWTTPYMYHIHSIFNGQLPNVWQNRSDQRRPYSWHNPVSGLTWLAIPQAMSWQQARTTCASFGFEVAAGNRVYPRRFAIQILLALGGYPTVCVGQGAPSYSRF